MRVPAFSDSGRSPGYVNDPIYWALGQILHSDGTARALGAAWAEWRGGAVPTRVTPRLTRYRPFREGRAVLEVEFGTGRGVLDSTLIGFTVSKDPARLGHLMRAAQEVQAAVDAPPALRVRPWSSVAWPIGRSPKLPGLGELLTDEGFRSRLSPDGGTGRTNVVRWVLHRRAILSWKGHEGQRLYAKIYRRGRDEAGAANLARVSPLSEPEGLLITPRLRQLDPAAGAFSMTALPGSAFTRDMESGNIDAHGLVGAALAHFHGSQVAARARWTRRAELDKVRTLGGEIPMALPALGHTLEEIFQALSEAPQPTSDQDRPIHGNLFGDQILIDGDRVGLVDWDDLALGDHHFDLGRLLAHQVYVAGEQGLAPEVVRRCADEFIRSYRSSGGNVNDDALCWHTTAALVLRGKISALRKLPPGWPERLRFVASESKRLVEGRSPYLDLPALHAGRTVVQTP